MHKMFKNLISYLLVTGVFLSFAPFAFASLGVSIQSKPVGSGSYSHNTSIQSSQSVVFYVTIVNNDPTTADNVFLQVNFPGANATSHSVSANVNSSSNGGGSDSTTVAITDSSGHLVLKPSTTVINWNKGSQVLSGNLLPDSINSSGINFGSLLSGGTYTIQLLFQANVSQDTNSASSGGSGSASSQSSPSYSCNESKPATVKIESAVRTKPQSVTLAWNNSESASSYSISYGLMSRKYQYGVSNLGKITQYTINDLDPNATYYFTVIPLHGCMPGEWSNEAKVGLTIGLNTPEGAKTVQKVVEPTPTPTTIPTPTVEVTNVPVALDTEEKPSKFNFSFPKISFPQISIPRFTMPVVTLPKFSMPTLTFPQIQIPQFKLPEVKLPNVKLPTMTMPQFSLPKVSIPQPDIHTLIAAARIGFFGGIAILIALISVLLIIPPIETSSPKNSKKFKFKKSK